MWTAIVVLAVLLLGAIFTANHFKARADEEQEIGDGYRANVATLQLKLQQVWAALTPLATQYGVILDGDPETVKKIKERTDHAQQDWANRLNDTVTALNIYKGDVARLNDELNACQQLASTRLHRIEELEAQLSARATATAYTPEYISRLVDEFLRWPLPESVSVDPCAMTLGQSGRVGTNLLSAEEARQMFTDVLHTVGQA